MENKKNKNIEIINKKDLSLIRKRLISILNQKNKITAGNLLPMVKSLLTKRDKILACAKKYPTPFYLLDKKELELSISSFSNAFNKFFPQCEFFYAMKVNHHPYIIKRVLNEGFGLDVSSSRELELALKYKAKKIVFNGPGKTFQELELAFQHSDKIIINVDSFGELEKIKILSKKYKKEIKVGVRIFTKYHGSWTKFGIPLTELKQFWDKTKNFPLIKLEGIHSHMSFNNDVKPYRYMLRELSVYLKNNFNRKELKSIKFIDFGGGFRPYQSEGYYPWKLPMGSLVQLTNNYFNKKIPFIHRYYIIESVPIEDYAKGISKAVHDYLDPLVNCVYYTEPGRIICNNAMHVILKIVNVKKNGSAIADGGINIVGWERFEHYYFPLINLTHPSDEEIPYNIYGCLCMTEDVWGYYCYASNVQENDIILVPYQGAMTYSLAQNFIKPIPKAYVLN